MMNHPVLLVVVAGGIGFALCFVACSNLLRRNRPFFSRLMDRYKVRPSQVFAGGSTVWGLLSLAIACNLPMSMWSIQFIYIINAAIATALGVDIFRNPPPQEYRPNWYQGDGNPDWLVGKQRRKFPPQIGIASVSAATFVLCVYFAVYSNRLADGRARQVRREVTIQRVRELGGVVQETMLSLAGTDITDDDLAMLVDLEIHDLNLGATSITNAGLVHVADIRGIHSLNLSGTNVDDRGLRHLSKLRLGILKLRKTRVTGTGIPIPVFQQYSVLDLSLCPVSKGGVDSLAEVRVGYLNLSQTKVDDSMLDGLKTLQAEILDVSRTKLSEKGVDSLAAERPDVQVRR